MPETRLSSFIAAVLLGIVSPLYGQVSVTINANTSNQVFTVTGTGCAAGSYTTPQTLQWAPGTSCTVQFVSPYSQQVGTQYVMTGWQDGITGNPRVIVTPAQSTTYTASFKTQYQAIVLANPPGGGTVSGGGWVDTGGTTTLTATAVAGYRFVNWSGSVNTSANPTSVQLYYSQNITANFTPVTNPVPGNWSAMQIATQSIGFGINTFGQVAGQSVNYPFLWTPIAANSAAGTLMNLSNSTNLTAAAAVNDYGQVLFSQTNYSGIRIVPYGPTSLWTPTVPQGITGNTTVISTESGTVIPAINNFGQVGTYINGSPAIWTPTTPNGASGAATPNAQWQGLSAMNGFGQAIVGSTLFTPLARNGTVGTLTAVTGLAGAAQTVLVAITEAGAVLGYSCVVQSSGGCQNQGFIWTPSTANGISGTTVVMPMPPGFLGVTPTAINATGNVVGSMTPSSGSTVPFLYTAATYYDLTTISGVPVGAVPAGINQSGQIIVNSSPYPGETGTVYLLTPLPNPTQPPPGAVSVTINANTGAVFTVTGTACAAGSYTTPQTLQWAPGTSCTVQFVSPYSQQVGTQYVMTGWQDGITGNPRVIVTPAQSTTYTATFKTQYQAVVLVNPPGGGTVTGGGWVDSGGTTTLTATAAAGYRFVNWSGSVNTSANPTSVQLYYSQNITANFTPVTNAAPGNWSAMQIATQSIGFGINTFGQVAGQSVNYPFLWTPIAANSAAGTLMNLSNSTNLTAAAAVNDYGQVLFSQTNYSGIRIVPYGPTSLWTPTVPQGITGNTTVISTESGTVIPAINNFGQVGTYINGSPAIWTPTTPNGASGAATPNAQWQGLSAMNGFGQAIVGSTLFTPLARNGTVGTLTAVTGLAGAAQTVLVAITEGGAVLGYSCVVQSSGGCQNQGFIWTPSTANGISGTTVVMPMPPGFLGVTPTAINATGNVVGSMTPSSGSTVPFLYTAATYYDLTTISGVPVGAVPAGINQSGQIIVNSSPYPGETGTVYLLTPISPILSITKSHTGNFSQGQIAGAFNIVVSNQVGPGVSAGTVTVTDTLPTGLTATAIAGTNWNCTLATLTCTRSDSLAGGASYPPIVVTVNVAPNCPPSVTNQATVSGGGSPSASATDVTTVASAIFTTIQTSPAGLQFTVDGGPLLTGPQSLILTVGSHTIAVATTQSGTAGTQFVFTGWSDSGSASHSINVPAAITSYTATFKTQYQLTLVASPSLGGTVSPAGGAFYDAGTAVPINAAANTGYSFAFWSGDLNTVTDSQTITMIAPRTIAANFNNSCFTLSATSVSLPATGTSVPASCPDSSQPTCGFYPETPLTLTVTASGACQNWVTNSSNTTFVQVVSGASGTGTGTVGLTVMTNVHTGPRSAVVGVTSGNASASYLVTETGSVDNLTYREVYALYEQLLGRDPDQSGFAFWTGVSSVGLGPMADDFLTSPEAFGSDFAVMAAYQAATGTPPTYAQFAVALASIRTGAQTVSGLFNSLITAKYTATNLYQNLLSRQPLPSEAASANTAGLASTFQTLIGYPAGTSIGGANNEFQSTGTFHTDHTNSLYVQMLYYVILSRDIDPGGFAFWVGIANAGGPGIMFQGTPGYNARISILGIGTANEGFIGSPEFQGLFAN